MKFGVSAIGGLDLSFLDQRPLVVALAGPNGAGKTTFYHVFFKDAGLRFLNADDIARDLEIDPYEAAGIAAELRRHFIKQRESLIFETVFSDPVGDKLSFLKDAARSGYTVVLFFIGLSDAGKSEERVAMRVSQGGHGVPNDKLISRFPRILENLRAAIRELPYVILFDNDDLRTPYNQVAFFGHGRLLWSKEPLPRWLSQVEGI